MKLSELRIHPVKSCAALSLTSACVEPRGLAHDRRWMVVDENGRFVSGRESPAMVRVIATPTSAGLHLSAPESDPIEVATPQPDATRRTVTVWDDDVAALDAGDRAAAWFSQRLERCVRLVHMDPEARRRVDPDRARPEDEVSFADGYPLLLISQGSLEALNARLARPIPMARFRPNLVVDGVAPHAEDGWKRLRIGEVEFEAVKPCVRCVFTTVDHERGVRDPDGEPLRTLTSYRRGPKGITFGVNLIPRGRGVLRCGDAVVAG